LTPYLISIGIIGSALSEGQIHLATNKAGLNSIPPCSIDYLNKLSLISFPTGGFVRACSGLREPAQVERESE
jgi:hypothetical protein